MPEPSVNQFLATTLGHYSKKIADNVANSNAVLYELKKKGRSKVLEGGREVVETLAYDEEIFAWYSGLDQLSRAEQETLSEAKFDWAMGSASVTLSNEDILKNRGKAALHNLMGSKLENAERTLKNKVAIALQSDGSDPKSLVGLSSIIADDPTVGVVGGIDAAVWDFWRNQVQTANRNVGELEYKTLRSAMNTLWRKCVRGSDKPSVITADDETYGVFEEGLQDNQRYVDADMAKLGFETLKYKTANVVYDGQDNNHPGGMQFINTNYLKFVAMSGRNFQPIDLPSSTPDIDGVTKHIGIMAALTCSNRSLQGRLLVA